MTDESQNERAERLRTAVETARKMSRTGANMVPPGLLYDLLEIIDNRDWLIDHAGRCLTCGAATPDSERATLTDCAEYLARIESRLNRLMDLGSVR